MSYALAKKEEAKFSKITVTLTLESAEELKVFRAMVGRDNTLPRWLQDQRSITHAEGVTLGGILDAMYKSVMNI